MVSAETFNEEMERMQRIFRSDMPLVRPADRNYWLQAFSAIEGNGDVAFKNALNAYIRDRNTDYNINTIYAFVGSYIRQRNAFKNIIQAIEAIFPGTVKDAFSFNLWFENLRDIEYSILSQAVNVYIQSQHFPPKVADIRMLATKIATGTGEPEPAAEWHRLCKALGQASAPDAEEIYDSLPEPTKRAVGGFGAFKEMSLMDLDTLTRVTKPMFEKQYTAIYRTILDRAAVSPGYRLPDGKHSTLMLSASSLARLESGGGLPTPKRLETEGSAWRGGREKALGVADSAGDDGAIQKNTPDAKDRDTAPPASSESVSKAMDRLRERLGC